MSSQSVHLPLFPRLPALALRWVPVTPLSMALAGFARHLAQRHPGMFRRLGRYDQTRFVLDPTDLPISILLEPRGGKPRLYLSRRKLRGDARIAGPLAGLLGMVHGTYDGDALFFSRDLLIEGDTAAVLALRNAIDDAELDLSAEAQAMSGPFAAQVKRLIALAEARTGVALSRHEEIDGW
ncbi:SCP2 sterol-binding domain-containing protein [Pseudooceanicola sp.]|uniref:ubiquinone anaerobic biosynthesis accessory factor UbiT n=1 Tax=Pseudooceanicola sp. TaxID=1914328 RepID=UPI00260F7E32|nr:SCP2 sterol-binding domain-containing protein [Pseudooceanicola sp.]MDF1854661.1 SCP2 sterol-binding domain-containing protein [Pseudooceanicola sp.]